MKRIFWINKKRYYSNQQILLNKRQGWSEKSTHGVVRIHCAAACMCGGDSTLHEALLLAVAGRGSAGSKASTSLATRTRRRYTGFYLHYTVVHADDSAAVMHSVFSFEEMSCIVYCTVIHTGFSLFYIIYFYKATPSIPNCKSFQESWRLKLF